MFVAINEVRRGTKEVGTMGKGVCGRGEKGGMEDRVNTPRGREVKFK